MLLSLRSTLTLSHASRPYQMAPVANMIRWRAPQTSLDIVSGTVQVIASATRSGSADRSVRWRRTIMTVATPAMKPKPIAEAKALWRTSSLSTKTASSSHAFAENAATPNMDTPNVPCSKTARGPQVSARTRTSQRTASPYEMKPMRATQAPSTAWAADSLTPCSTQE